MRKIFGFILLCILFTLSIPEAFAYAKLQGIVQRGNGTAYAPTTSTTLRVAQTYPSATVTVYRAGTTTLATIYSTGAGAAKANPFTAGTDASWSFYAANGSYDVRFSGGGITTPFTYGALGVQDNLPVSNVQSFGALCDGSTNDAAAFAAASALGGRILIPAATCKVGAITVAGSNTHFEGTAGVTKLIPNGTIDMFTLTSLSDVSFRGITFDMTAYPVSVGVRATSPTRLTIDNCRFLYGDKAISVSTPTALRVTNCDISNTGQWGMYINGPTGAFIDHNVVHNTQTLDGIKIGVDLTVLTGTATVSYDAGNGKWKMTGSGSSFVADGVAGGKYIATIDANGFTGQIASSPAPTSTAFWLDNWSTDLNSDGDALDTGEVVWPGGQLYLGAYETATDVTITNNEVYSCAQGAVNVDSNGARNILIAGNTLRDSLGGYGIVAKQVYEGTTYENVQIANNLIVDNASGGISVQRNDLGATMRNIIVTGNLVSQTNDVDVCIRSQMIDGLTVIDNRVYSGISGGQGILIVGGSRQLIVNNDVTADKALEIAVQSVEQTMVTTVFERNTLRAVNDVNTQAIISAAAAGTGVVTNISGVIVRYNTLVLGTATAGSGAWSEQGLSTTTGAAYYQNVIGQTANGTPPTRQGRQGDVIMIQNPTTGSFTGYVCTTSGAPGTTTWKTYGPIS